MTLTDNDAIFAECEALLRQALDLIDEHRLSRLIAARLAHLIHDVAAERQIEREYRPPA